MTTNTITGNQPYSRPLDLGPHLNNKGTSRDGASNGVGLVKGETFPSAFLPTGTWLHDGIAFTLPDDWDAETKDNIRADGEVVALPQPEEASALHLVAVGDDPRGALHKEAKMDFDLAFEDGSTVAVPVEIKNWWAYNGMSKGPIRAPFHFEKKGVKNNAVSSIFHLPVPLPISTAGKRLVSIRLPSAGKWNALHVFAMSYVPALATPPAAVEDKIVPAYVRATRRWEDVGDVRAQVVEVALANPVSVKSHADRMAWIDRQINLSLAGSTFETVRPASVPRLMPGDMAQVEVLVRPTSSSAEFDDSMLELTVDSHSWSVPVSTEGSLVHDFTQWTADEDVEKHSAPAWFTGAKFGVFIHWGLYSVPAWADCEAGKYAEWYWFWQHTKDVNGPGTYNHHLKTYGADFVYDDFIPMFTADKFDPSTWVDLFADAGAKYFVFTTKHHDGYALFDTEQTSNRNSLLLGPKRDFVAELFDASKARHPDLKLGAYYSMPEWYNPLYEPYGRDDGALSFFGGLAHNAYRPGETEPYTGHVDEGDYIQGLQVPQLQILADKYKADMIWGDIGMANDSIPFVAKYYSAAAAEGRQVTINNRLGIAGDFVTPEMETFDTVQSQVWEACASVDPYSFGYNAATKDDEYRSTADLVHTLVDIVAKGGNFLLNIGPCADGSIAEPITRRLEDIGQWLKINGRAIYNTHPYRLLHEVRTEDTHVQFTRTHKALYIISLKPPTTPHFTVTAPLPILPSDTVALLTATGDVQVPFSYKNGSLKLDLSHVKPEALQGEVAYVFEVAYSG